MNAKVLIYAVVCKILGMNLLFKIPDFMLQVYWCKKTYCSTNDWCLKQSREVTGCHRFQVKTPEKLFRSRSSFTRPEIWPSGGTPRLLSWATSPASPYQLPHWRRSATASTFWTKRLSTNRWSLSEWSWHYPSYVGHGRRTTFYARSNASSCLQIPNASNVSSPNPANVHPWTSSCYDDAPAGASPRTSPSPRSPGPSRTAHTFHSNFTHLNFIWKCFVDVAACDGHALELKVERRNERCWLINYCFVLFRFSFNSALTSIFRQEKVHKLRIIGTVFWKFLKLSVFIGEKFNE